MSTPALNRNPVIQTILVCSGIYVLFHALYYTKDFITPLLFATIFAILLDAAVGFLTRIGFNRNLAIILVLFLAIALAFGIILLIGYHASLFLEDIPRLLDRLSKVFASASHWVGDKIGISDQRMDELYEHTKNDQMNNSSAIVGKTLTNLNDLLVFLFLLPVYVFMLLFYKDHLLKFLRKRLFKKEQHRNLEEILAGIKSLVQFYLLGLITEIIMVAGLNALGLSLIGVEYAILLGTISGLMNLIPYIGGIIAGGLAVVVAISSQTPFDAIWVVISFSVVQFVDNTFIVPLIVGSRVKLNAFVSLVGVIAGGALWGISGMILSIPILGILKIIADKTEPLQSWGFLLGERETTESGPEKPIRAFFKWRRNR